MMDNKVSTNSFDVSRIRSDFPILTRNFKSDIPLIYLDSSATSQKPEVVIKAMDEFYRKYNANIHRGIHTLAEEATALYENARERVTEFIASPSSQQVIFTRNTTESINLVAYSWGRSLQAGDVIILTEMEHHSNLIPWLMLAEERGVQLKYIPVREDGLLDLDTYDELLKLEPKLVAFTQMSNVLGTITPAVDIVRKAHDAGAITLVDGAQSVPHFPVDVQKLDADFLAFSAHKMVGPTGIGVLYGKKELLENMPPFLGGGDMIKRVHFDSFTTNQLPYKFEAGTPAIAEAIGFGAAIDYLSKIGMDNIAMHEHDLVQYAMDRLMEIPGVHILGPDADHRGGVVSFTMDGVHPHDIAQVLNSYGIAVRAGHHCAMPLHERFKIPASTRASFYLYNQMREVDLLAEALNKTNEIFRM
jgi:cysteine desulfurase/selenocysteine lyase